jgi:chromosome segregation ATPase
LSEAAEDAVTTKVSNQTRSWTPRVDSLERECHALKAIIRADSTHILKLKKVVETLQAQLAKITLENKKLEAELQSVKKERDLLNERDLQHLETIKVLKQEVDMLTKTTSMRSENGHKELEQLQIENELFAAQIIENEVEMREIRSLLEFLDSENAQMRKDLELVRGQIGTPGRVESRVAVDQSETNLAEQLAQLAAKIATFELEREETKHLLENEKIQRAAEIDSIKQMIQVRNKSLERTSSVAINSNGEGVEVTLDGPIDPKNCKPPNAERANTCSFFCDCFPSPDKEG